MPTPTPKAVDYKEGLKKLGYYKERSKDTNLNWRNAIVLFQSDHNLKVDGSWGKQSSGALNKRLTAAKYTYLDKVTTAPSKGKWITINKTKRILTLYLDKTVIKKYPIAVGNPPSLTPDGKFKIVNKIINPAWGGGGYAPPVKGGSPNNPLGYRWMGLSIKGGSSYGIHGTNSPYSIGTNASHGCIRMPNFCVEELFSLISLNTDVWIGSEEKLSSWGVTQPAY
ncbi:MAG: L,D-transpeptidase family protein [Clostridia bacterium]|nr:L,D-transpeptidase family protein [Clostridia bacterium]